MFDVSINGRKTVDLTIINIGTRCATIRGMDAMQTKVAKQKNYGGHKINQTPDDFEGDQMPVEIARLMIWDEMRGKGK